MLSSSNSAIYRIGNKQNILYPRCKEQNESHPRFYLLLQAVQNYSRIIWTIQSQSKLGTSSQQHDGIHLKILPSVLKLFFRHLSCCCRKAFNEGFDKFNNFSNFKCNLVSQFNSLQDAASELGSKNTFLRTSNSILKPCNWSLDVQLYWFYNPP